MYDNFNIKHGNNSTSKFCFDNIPIRQERNICNTKNVPTNVPMKCKPKIKQENLDYYSIGDSNIFEHHDNFGIKNEENNSFLYENTNDIDRDVNEGLIQTENFSHILMKEEYRIRKQF
eukprot:UN04219